VSSLGNVQPEHGFADTVKVPYSNCDVSGPGPVKRGHKLASAFALFRNRGIVKLNKGRNMASKQHPEKETESAARVGQQVRKARKFLKLSQEEAARRMGWSRLKWSQTERGGVKVSASEIERLGWLFGVSPGYFFSLNENPENSTRWASLRQGEIGKRAQKARLYLGLTQSGMAEEVGCSHAKWSRIEQGKAELSASELDRLVHKLDISLDQFFSLAPDWLETTKQSPVRRRYE
jgi:transcriptional regulator with XRE-family HTH domain